MQSKKEQELVMYVVVSNTNKAKKKKVNHSIMDSKVLGGTQ